MSVVKDDYRYADYLLRSRDNYALAKYRIILKWLPQRENLVVLNAGCGSGEMNIFLSRNRTWHIVGIDMDDRAISMSRQLKDRYGVKNLDIIQANVQEYDGAESYDIIVCIDVLEHIEDDLQMIKRLSQMLKPEGLLCVSVPALQGLFGYHDEMLGHYRRYDKHSLTRKLSQEFQVKKCRYFGFSLTPVALLYSRWLRRPYPVGQQKEGSMIKNILEAMLWTETRMRLPVGTSLIALAVSKISNGRF